MSIILYSGTPGSYKSYHATADVIAWLRSGRNVIANFCVDSSKYFKHRKVKGAFYFKTNEQITVNMLVEFAKQHHKPGKLKAQTLVVIDEASIMFNARQFDRKDRMDWINFFANHRHMNYDIILIAQNDRMLDRQIRGLLEYDMKHRALKNMNLVMALASTVAGGLYHCVEYWYPCKLKTNTQLHRFSKRIAACYDTMATFDFKHNDNNSNNDEQNAQEQQAKSKIDKNAMKQLLIKKGVIKNSGK